MWSIFHFIDAVFWSTNVLNFNEVKFISFFSFSVYALEVLFKNYLPKFTSMFYPKKFIVSFYILFIFNSRIITLQFVQVLNSTLSTIEKNLPLFPTLNFRAFKAFYRASHKYLLLQTLSFHLSPIWNFYFQFHIAATG